MTTQILLFTVIKAEIILETHDSGDLVFKIKHWLLLKLQIKTILLIWNQPCPSRATEITLASWILASRSYGFAYIELFSISLEISSSSWKKLQLVFQKTSQISTLACLPTLMMVSLCCMVSLCFTVLLSALHIRLCCFSIFQYTAHGEAAPEKQLNVHPSDV